jgi:hypothetical protein
MRLRSIVIVLAAAIVVATAVHRWFRPPPAASYGHERPDDIVTPPAAPETPVPSLPAVAAPTAAEVQPALDDVFERTVTEDPAAAPAFLAGDFNGDGVADLAVVVRPRGPEALPEINAAMARFGVQDAALPLVPAGAPARPAVAADERLLAVIHGGLPGGWRERDARQGYLVKNAVGTDLARRPLRTAPDDVRMKVIRVHVGDVIAQRRGGRPGIVLWTGAAYVWADLQR